MLTVHHLGISQSDRVGWLCEELGLPYQLVVHHRDPVTRMAPESYRSLHPSGTAPVIEDDGLALAESGAIIDYIVAKYGEGRLTLKPDHPAFATCLFWYHMGNGSIMPAAMMLMAGEGMMADMGRARLGRYYGTLEQQLADGRPWLAGDIFTIADIMIAFPLTTMRLFVPYDFSAYPNIRAYAQRLIDRPAYQAAKAKCDPELVLPAF